MYNADPTLLNIPFPPWMIMADYFGFRARLLSLLVMAVLAGDGLLAGDVKPVREILSRYCSDCHTGSSAVADVELDLLDSEPM